MVLYSTVTFFVVWIIFIVEAESSQVESPVYGVKGGSVRLTVDRPQDTQIRRITWTIDSTAIVEHTLDGNFTHRYNNDQKKLQFDITDFSLLVKNLEETDEGVYTASIIETNGKTSENKYLLHVQKAVSKPIIKLESLSFSPAGGHCNVSVNCSVSDIWVSYTCDQTQCTQVELRSQPDVNITVTPYNGNIICTGSNQISRETQSEPLSPKCMMTPDPPSYLIFHFLIFPILALLLIGIVIIYFCKYRGNLQSDNTMCSTPQRMNRAPSINDNQEPPLTVYCTLGEPMDQLHPVTPPPAQPDTSIYSQVKK